MKKKLSIATLGLLIFASCASNTTKEACPPTDVEPVSTCRAIERCKQQKTSYGVGLGVGLGSNLGLGMSQSQNTENYTDCVDKDLKAQDAQHQVKQSERQISNNPEGQ